jgi:NADPH:quinone reductase-like Zn-dependent oxidoreductase
MKAIVYTQHGPPDILTLAQVDMPTPVRRQVLVRVRAAAVNPLDWHLIRGEPSFLRLMVRGARHIPGYDVAGQVERVGPEVTQFRPGDEVFGAARGAFADYACTTEDRLVRKPAALTFEQAATIPVAGCTALQGLRTHGRLRAGQRVLINGAAGGVGTFAVQIARALGAEVTGVCSTRNVDLLRSIGAHHVIDYTAEDFTRGGQRYDLVLQVAGNRTADELRRVLTPDGTLVIVGGGTGREENDTGSMLEVIRLMLAGHVLSKFMRPRALLFMARIRQEDLRVLVELTESGRLTPVIDRTYPLTEAAEAIRYLEAGHARGKVVVSV